MPSSPLLLFTCVHPLQVTLHVRCPGPIGSCSPVYTLCVFCCVCRVLGHLAPVQRCTLSVCCAVCAVSLATWLLFTGVCTRRVVLRVRCPGPLDSCSPVCTLRLLCCVCGVLHLFTAVPTRRVVLRLQCHGLLGSCSAVCKLDVLCCVRGVLGHLAPVHWCVRPVCCVPCAVSWSTWLLFTAVHASRVTLRLGCPGPLGSFSPLYTLGVWCCVCRVLGHLAPVHRCVRSACCVACAVSWSTWLLFTGLHAPRVTLRVRCPGPLASCSPVCRLVVLCCVCGVLLVFTGVPPPRVVVHLQCSGPLGSCSAVCTLDVLCCVCCVMGTCLPLTRVHVPRVRLCVRCLGPLGSCSPVYALGVWCCVCRFLGDLAPVHRCVRSACCVACAVFWSTLLLFTGVHAPRVTLCVRCPGPLGSCSPVYMLGVLCCVCRVLGHLAHAHRCTRSVCCAVCAMSSATWLLLTGVHARRVVLRLQCPGPLGCSSVGCTLDVLCCVCGVLGHLAPVHRCVRPVCCVVCAVSWSLGSCSPVCTLDLLCCFCGVPGHLPPVHRCAPLVCCSACVGRGCEARTRPS